MHSKSNNIKVKSYNDENGVVNELFESLQWIYQGNVQQYNINNKSSAKPIYFLIDASSHEVNRLFVLSFKDQNGRESYKQCYLQAVKIKDYNVLTDGRDFFD